MKQTIGVNQVQQYRNTEDEIIAEADEGQGMVVEDCMASRSGGLTGNVDAALAVDSFADSDAMLEAKAIAASRVDTLVAAVDTARVHKGREVQEMLPHGASSEA